MLETAFANELSDTSIEIPQPVRTGNKHIFSVAQLLTNRDRQNEGWSRGGQIIDGALTLGHQNGYLAPCEITELQQAMPSEGATNFHPAERKHMTKGYNKVSRDAKTGVVTKQTVGFDKEGKHDGLLRTPFYPSDEVQTITAKNDGTIEMPVANAQERQMAQLFLFPNWERIKQGLDQLPGTIAELQAHFQKRLVEAQATGDMFFVNVAEAAIRSCLNYRGYGETHIGDQKAIYDQAKVQGWAWSFGTRARLLSAQLGIQLGDDLVQQNADKMDRLVEAQTRTAEQQGELIALQLRREKIAAGLDPDAPLPVVGELGGIPVPQPAVAEADSELEVIEVEDEPELVNDPELVSDEPVGAPAEFVACGAMTGKNEPCRMPAEEDGYCKIASHKAQASN